ncbi:MAG: alpha/beta hydrolase [Pirellulaceae bacterium]
MQKSTILKFVCFAVVSLIVSPAVNAEDTIKEQILELFPQADTNNDGVISDAEEAVVSRQAMKRHPQADRDGDGVLSDAEKRGLLKMAGRGTQKPPASKNPSPAKSVADKSSHQQAPNFADVKYGENERHVLDLWLADSSKPTPLAIYIHGGGFTSGSKEKLKSNDLSQLLKAGVSVAAINYRYASTAPLPAAHHDARRALQFLRFNADKWNIDKDKVAVFGGSAGAQISMWLAFSDEMANPKSNDPIDRESTRLSCVATAGGQTSMDMDFLKNHMQPLVGKKADLQKVLGGGASKQKSEARRLATWGAENADDLDAKIESVAALSLISPDDPPIFMSYGMSPSAKLPSDPKRAKGWLIHHVFFGIALKEKMDAMNVESNLQHGGAKSKYESSAEFMIEKLTGK